MKIVENKMNTEGLEIMMIGKGYVLIQSSFLGRKKSKIRQTLITRL
jgi:hypothetical protein